KCNWQSRLALEFVDPIAFVSHVPGAASVTDRFFKLVSYQWADNLADGTAIDETTTVALKAVPIVGEGVEISGANLIVRPASATTDDQGVFGLLAFVDPAAFEKSAGAKAGTPSYGDLTLKYKQVIRTNRITGNFAEVIQAEGRITIVGGSAGSTVKVGDILSPGTTLSLSASIGEPSAQLGLRFVNGADAHVVQDVFTNACITDLIVIGQTEFTNKSVIAGKTPLMSISRYLCEQMAGFPNTPEEWAKATGKFAVKLAASAAVPVPMGYEAAAFAVKYAVGTVAGSAYDYTITSPGDNRVVPKSAARAVAKAATSDRRIEWRTYYDGSTRIGENFDADFALFQSAAAAPFATTAPGAWQELAGANAVARTWAHTPDTLDLEGPQLRLSYDYLPASLTMAIRLSALDPSGLDLASLAVTIDGIAGDVANAFAYRGDGVWVGEFIGSMVPRDYRVHASLADNLGHRASLDWMGEQVPGPPRALSAAFHGGKTWVEWDLPLAMAATDLLYYEVRQLWQAAAGWTTGPWQSVGTFELASLDSPAGLLPGGKILVEVRAWHGTGVAGTAARSAEFTAVVVTARLDVSVNGAGSGRVQGEAIDCGDDCVGFHAPGAVVSLVATPAAGSAFTGWTGDCSGTGACTVTMDASRSVAAQFALSANPPRLANIATRMQVLTGADVLIGGFIIGGSQAKTVVVRARGPSLTAAGVPGALQNPLLQLFAGATLIAANDNWQEAANQAVLAASGFAPSSPFESALLVTLTPGAYTAIVTGAGDTTGVGIVEVFEVDLPEVPLINIATRGQVLTAADVMIGGFIIQGDGPQTVIVRARGPSLAAAGVPGALQDPVLQLFAGVTSIGLNDDWQSDTNAAQVLSRGFAPSDARESAMLVTLPPGAYTAIVTGKNLSTGVGIIEVFAQ
ncbi:MAG: hypothetical protein IPJ28_14640, partial [Betaproteobacteria bacterium]|nr:hypothetical protein [Betaproteobacteria bacterium]